MARPRTKLQVTTFPFLAVLLCAMGSLLLFLFIMDRRAKIASRNRAREAMEAMVAKKQETQAERDARQAEWEQAKEKLRRLLLEQQETVQADAKTVEQNLLDADRLLEIAQARLLELQPKVGSETAKIANIQHQIARERDHIQSAGRNEEASKLERTRATLELAELTIAFRELKARQVKGKEVYSLVPYRGKRGDSRAPIYVECGRDGVRIQPDRKLLPDGGFLVAALRAEIEKQAGPLTLAKSAKEMSRTPPGEKKGPYVLFLVRPSGIAGYYAAQAALRGFELDFGYELVDDDWVLDFGGTALAENRPLPTPVPVKDPIASAAPALLFNPPAGGVILVPSDPRGVAAGLGQPGSGSAGPLGTASPLSVPDRPGLGAVGSGPPPGFEKAPNVAGMGGGNAIAAAPAPIPGPTPVPIDSSKLGDPLAGLTPLPTDPLKGGGPLFAPTPGAGSSLTAPTDSLKGGGPLFAPTPGAGVPLAAPTPGAGAPLTAPTPARREPAFIPLARTASGSPTKGTTSQSMGRPTLGGAPGQPALIASSAPLETPGEVSVPKAPPPSPIAVDPKKEATPPISAPASGVNGNASLEPIMNRGPAFGTAANNPPPTAPALSRVIGNKDFVIIIDCFDDHVTIFPTATQYRWQGTNTRATDQAVVRMITKLIERRQASVQDGEPPYRPVIRFQVSPAGLRTYLHLYPHLEPLRVKMERQNVED